MSTDPSIQKDVKPEVADLLARAESQFQMSRELVAVFLRERQEGERAIQDLIDSNNKLVEALLLAKGTNQDENSNLIPPLEPSEMKLCLSLVAPRHLATGTYFDTAPGKVLLELAKAHFLGKDGITVSEIAAATGYVEGTVNGCISKFRTYRIGPRSEYGTETGKGYEIRKVAKDKWALIKLGAEFPSQGG